MPKNAVKAWAPDPFNAAMLGAAPKLWNIGGPNAGFPQPVFMLEFTNDSNTACDIWFYNDVHQQQHIRFDTSLTLNFQTNHQPQGNVACFPMGAQVWISGTAGIGFIYMTGYYTEQT